MFHPRHPGRVEVAAEEMAPVVEEEEGWTEGEWREEECRVTEVEEEEEGSEPATQEAEEMEGPTAQRREETVRLHRLRTTIERPTSC